MHEGESLKELGTPPFASGVGGGLAFPHEPATRCAATRPLRDNIRDDMPQ